jgi:transcriptional regulator
MYSLPYFKEPDQRVVLDFIKEHPFATLIGAGDRGPVATQVPILTDEHRGERLILRGHIMRNTDHHKAFQQNDEALCLFTGAHTYVSASWYSDPLTASTWNYMSVHVRGTLRFLAEPELRRLLSDLTSHFENDDDSPSLYRHLPDAYVGSLVKAIIAFEIEVREIDNVFKLSQNRDRSSYDTIIQKLDAKGGDARIIADEMRKRRPQLFAPKQSDSVSSPSPA